MNIVQDVLTHPGEIVQSVAARFELTVKQEEIHLHQLIVDGNYPEMVRRASMNWLKAHNLRRSCGCPWPNGDVLP